MITHLTQHNWRGSEEFLDFLTFTYSPSKEVTQQCMHLLPIAVAEQRLLGNIQNALLTEALAIWNTPPAIHYFHLIPSLKRWSYKGTEPAKAGAVSLVVFGRLTSPILRGAFCSEPRTLLIKGYKELESEGEWST